MADPKRFGRMALLLLLSFFCISSRLLVVTKRKYCCLRNDFLYPFLECSDFVFWVIETDYVRSVYVLMRIYEAPNPHTPRKQTHC